MGKIQDCVEYVETTVKANITLSGSNAFPNEQQMTGLFGNFFEGEAEFQARSDGWGQSFHSAVAYILGPQSNMFEVYKQLEGKLETICVSLMNNPTLGGNCDTSGPCGYKKTIIELAGVKYAGYELYVNNIKIKR